MTEHRSFIENLPNFRGDSQWGDRAIDEILRLRAALTEQGLLQKKPGGGMVWHAHDCPASFDFAQCNYRCRVARAALEGRE